MSEEKTTYKGFSVGDRVYYYKKGCCPSLPSCLIGAILKIQTGKESATFVVHDEKEDFLFQSDCAGNISRSACVALYERIHNYDNNIAYGFRIVKDSFGNLIRQELGFQDFVELIKECIDTNCDLLWS